MDSQRFVNYYVNQAGGGPLGGFVGAPVMYGRGLGSMLSRAFRFVIPFLKQGAKIAKPHLKSAVKGIASDVVGSVTKQIINPSSQPQEGSGLLRIARSRGKRSLTALSHNIPKKRRKTTAKKHRKLHTQHGEGNIF